MSVLRANKESLMAVLEAFIYDPLMNWRLTQPSGDIRRTGASFSEAQEDLLMLSPDSAKRDADLARVATHLQGPSRKLKADENYIFNGSSPVVNAQASTH
jgi:FKBP12-rapamycin complex-associated protein